MAVRIEERPYPEGFHPAKDRWHMRNKVHEKSSFHVIYPRALRVYQLYYGLVGAMHSLGGIPFSGSISATGRSGGYEMHGELTVVDATARDTLEFVLAQIRITAEEVCDLDGINYFEITFVQEVEPKLL